VIFKILIPFVVFSSLFAASMLKVECDRYGEQIYFDNKFKAECDDSELVKILVKPGNHFLKAVKKNSDGSYRLFEKKFQIGDGVEKMIRVRSVLKYTDAYYYNQSFKSLQTAKAVYKKTSRK